MGCIIAGESHQDHVDNGQNGENQDTHHRQSQHGLVELVIHQRAQVILAALDLLALGSDIHADAALLHLHSPGADKGGNEDDGQQAVEQDLHGVVTGNPDIGIKDGVILEFALDGTHSGTNLEPVSLCQPVQAAAGNQHICYKHYFKHKEQKSSHDLTVV